MYNSLHFVLTHYSANNIPRAQFLAPCALLGRRLQFFAFFLSSLVFS